jgi:olefin beta-lactone synthetase
MSPQAEVFNLAEVALDVARRDPDRVAVVEPAGRDANGRRQYRRYTYRELSDEVESVAPGLRALGVSEGTRTVCMAPPSFEAAVAFLALNRVGAFTVWIDPAVGYRNVGERLRRIQPEAFVGLPLAHVGRMAFGWGPRFLSRAVVVRGRFPGARTLASLRAERPAEPTAPAVGPDDPVAIFYTTGSTGPAKPTLYLHRNFVHLFRIVHQTWRFAELKEIPVDMPAFPAFFFVALSAGGTFVVPPIDFARQGPADVNAAAVLEVINDCGVQSMFGSPALLDKLGRHAMAHGLRTPSLRRVIGGGAPIVASAIQPLLAMMGDDGEVWSNYGATEALPSTEMGARETLAETWARTEEGAGVCVGRPFEGVDVRIIRMTDAPLTSFEQAQEVPQGAIGEIVVRSPHVSPSYYQDQVNTEKHKLRDVDGTFWHRIGDAGYLDEAGRLWYCGRVSQRVRSAAGDLHPSQCEPVFDAHPKVRRSGLVAVSAPGGDVPVICVEVEKERRRTDLDALRAELLALAAKYPATRQIEHVQFHPSLPVDPRHNSKIERPKLARWASRRFGRAPVGHRVPAP